MPHGKLAGCAFGQDLGKTVPPAAIMLRSLSARELTRGIGGDKHAQILFQLIAEPDQGRALSRREWPGVRAGKDRHPQGAEQFTPEFLRINPNAKVPAIDDGGTIVFDSNAILLYLAEKTGKFLPAASVRGETLSWLMFIATGLGPYSGQAVHFKHFSPKDQAYAHNRYQFEGHRHYQILDDHLAKHRYMVGDKLLHRRHGPVGLGAHGAFVLGEGCAREISEREAVWSTRSPRGRRQRARSR